MGSPLSPVIANFFMEEFEKKATKQAAHRSVGWFRCVDDTFVIWPHGQEILAEFLNHLNGLHNKHSLQWKKKKKATFHSWTLTSTEKWTVP
jgi:hypothetical protein